MCLIKLCCDEMPVGVALWNFKDIYYNIYIYIYYNVVIKCCIVRGSSSQRHQFLPLLCFLLCHCLYNLSDVIYWTGSWMKLGLRDKWMTGVWRFVLSHLKGNIRSIEWHLSVIKHRNYIINVAFYKLPTTFFYSNTVLSLLLITLRLIEL